VRKEEPVGFHVALNPVQTATIIVAVLLVGVIAFITFFSDSVELEILGLFSQLLGGILLGLGLIKTNDELVELGSHHIEFDKQRFIRHLTKDRFFIVLGVFFVVAGLLLQILSKQLGL
jgi:hypothetical protein